MYPHTELFLWSCCQQLNYVHPNQAIYLNFNQYDDYVSQLIPFCWLIETNLLIDWSIDNQSY